MGPFIPMQAADTSSTPTESAIGGQAERELWNPDARDPRSPAARVALSVILPVWNEAAELAEALATARASGVELVVVDAGSTDGSAGVAEQSGARVIRSGRGRGAQLRAGAAVATGEALLFLHADARLPAGYASRVASTLEDRSVAVGAFRLRIDAAGTGLRWIEWGVRQRCRWLGMPYGDQALFVRTEVYRALGGFAPLPAMEDMDFVRRARRLGVVRTLDEPVTVSARAWRRRGLLRMTAINAVSAAAFLGGVSAERIARWRSAGLH